MSMTGEFALYEPILWDPPAGYFLLEYHLNRLERSAAHFHFRLDITGVQKQLSEYAPCLPQVPPPRSHRSEDGHFPDKLCPKMVPDPGPQIG